MWPAGLSGATTTLLLRKAGTAVAVFPERANSAARAARRAVAKGREVLEPPLPWIAEASQGTIGRLTG
eukprot:11703326-Alexandrium_andersonii.AAC.1